MVVLTADTNELGFFSSLDPFSQGFSFHSSQESDAPWFYFGNEEAKVFPSELDVLGGSDRTEPISSIPSGNEHPTDYPLPDRIDDLPIYGVHPILPDLTASDSMVRCFYPNSP